MTELFYNPTVRLALISIVIAGVALLMEYLICKFTRKKIIAFILPSILLILAIIMILCAKLLPFEDLADLALIVMCIPIALSSVVTFVFAFIYKRKK